MCKSQYQDVWIMPGLQYQEVRIFGTISEATYHDSTFPPCKLLTTCSQEVGRPCIRNCRLLNHRSVIEHKAELAAACLRAASTVQLCKIATLLLLTRGLGSFAELLVCCNKRDGSEQRL